MGNREVGCWLNMLMPGYSRKAFDDIAITESFGRSRAFGCDILKCHMAIASTCVGRDIETKAALRLEHRGDLDAALCPYSSSALIRV